MRRFTLTLTLLLCAAGLLAQEPGNNPVLWGSRLALGTTFQNVPGRLDSLVIRPSSMIDTMASDSTWYYSDMLAIGPEFYDGIFGVAAYWDTDSTQATSLLDSIRLQFRFWHPFQQPPSANFGNTRYKPRATTGYWSQGWLEFAEGTFFRSDSLYHMEPADSSYWKPGGGLQFRTRIEDIHPDTTTARPNIGPYIR